MSFDKLTPNQKVQAANIDCMRHHKFALLSGIICMGKSEVNDEVPTACTNGKDKLYGTEFINDLTRKELRFVVLHENFHVALKHCVLPAYIEYNKRFGPQICNAAMDFVVNGLIDELDPDRKFMDFPAKINILFDKKYHGMSYPQVLQELLKDVDEDEQPQAMDDHQMGGPGGSDGQPMDAEDQEKLGKMIDDANRQGELLARKLRGDEAGGRDILGTAQERVTNWRDALQDFINSVCVGDENSRFCPPNKRLLASGFIMPSHFDENVGEIIIACDTSGSMHWAYPVVFGEVARIAQNTRPDSIRMLWWDTAVCSDQVFKPDQYQDIATALAPKGGGGTVVSCVADYVAEHKIKAKAVIMLSDGYIESDYRMTDMPTLWGIVDNEDFMPRAGKVLRIRP
jgi:predicted metal-dependent peptidase